jgi:hypothetical protein
MSDMKRREFMILLGAATACRSRRAQQAGSCQPSDEGARDRCVACFVTAVFLTGTAAAGAQSYESS